MINCIDKASNNFVFVCKKFYLMTLMSELGIDPETFQCTGNHTYYNVTESEVEVV